MADDVVAEVRKNRREIIRVSLSPYEGRDLINLRVWFEAEDGTMRPGKSGLACRVDLLPELAEALRKAEDEARTRGLLP